MNLTKENFDKTLEKNKVVMVDFWAEWCSPCRMLTPIVEEVENLMPNNVAKVNIEEERDLAAEKAYQEAKIAQSKNRPEPVKEETTTEERNPTVLENVVDATKAPVSALKNVVFEGTETIERGVRSGLNAVGFNLDESMIDIIDKKIDDYTNLGFFRNNDKGDLVWTGSLEDVNDPEKTVRVIDKNNKIIGSINPTKIINTVFGGRKNGI